MKVFCVMFGSICSWEGGDDVFWLQRHVGIPQRLCIGVYI